ncbi:MAG: hypothetical protein NT121_19965, partial [Chloroflexi bacterium]|nr:hypothetical protein [Chloroflexota bacterium]
QVKLSFVKQADRFCKVHPEGKLRGNPNDKCFGNRLFLLPASSLILRKYYGYRFWEIPFP